MCTSTRSPQAANLAAVERGPKALGELHARVAGRFLRPEVRQRAYRYLTGLLGRVERKHSWQMAEERWESVDLKERSGS